MQELKNVKNTEEKEQEKDSSSQNVNLFLFNISKANLLVRLFYVKGDGVALRRCEFEQKQLCY